MSVAILLDLHHSLAKLFKFYPTTFVSHADIVLPPGLLVLGRVSGLPMRNKVHLIILFLMAMNGWRQQ